MMSREGDGDPWPDSSPVKLEYLSEGYLWDPLDVPETREVADCQDSKGRTLD